MVQNITTPLGIPIQHNSIPFQTSIQGQTSNQNLPFLKERMADQMQFMIDTISMISSGRSETVSTGSRTASMSPFAGR